MEPMSSARSAVSEPPEISDDELDNLLADLTRDQRNLVLQGWIAMLRESAEIEDLRTDLLPLQ